MADVKKAVDFVMRQEDSTLSGIITARAGDRGGVTRLGLCQRWHPELVPQRFFQFSLQAGALKPLLQVAEALPIAESTYESTYAQALFLEQLAGQSTAAALLSFAVVEGQREAVKLLQKAIVAVTPVPARPKQWSNEPPPPVLDLDGMLGEHTVALANAADQAKLLAAYVGLEEGYFRHLVQVYPSQVVNLNGWINRARACLEA